MISATGLRRGMVIRKDGELFSVFSFTHLTPGNKRGFVQSKLRNLRTGALIDHRFRSVDTVERVALEQQEMEYLYKDGADYVFMNTTTYEQVHLGENLLGNSMLYLVPNITIRPPSEFNSPPRWIWRWWRPNPASRAPPLPASTNRPSWRRAWWSRFPPLSTPVRKSASTPTAATIWKELADPSQPVNPSEARWPRSRRGIVRRGTCAGPALEQCFRDSPKRV